MLRPDFSEIFEYIIGQCATYSLNTNGTLITPQIAMLLRNKGHKMIALYGATKDVHDNITRSSGSFDATMRGFQYLKEAGACFTVQLIPMRSNYHQFREMVALAQSLSKHYRIGASWFYLSAAGDKTINNEIKKQRLDPQDVISIAPPDLFFQKTEKDKGRSYCCDRDHQAYLFSSCVSSRRDFHIDPYGAMTFCCFLKRPDMRYDLRAGSFEDCWENFIPSLAKKIPVTESYQKSCGSCNLREDCRACPVYVYLEKGRFDQKIDYLCAVAKENKKFKDNWKKQHQRYFRIADMTVKVETDLPITPSTFHSKFRFFATSPASEDIIRLRHHFKLPDIADWDLGTEVYRRVPWAIYQQQDSWIYLGIMPNSKDLHQVAVFNADHTRVRIYNKGLESFQKGNLSSLTMFPSDQMLLARVLAHRQGFYLHSCGVDFQGKGLLFAGHSEAGKSTMATLLKGKAKILCDDRIIIRKRQGGFRIFGTWSHGDVPDVSVDSAPLSAIMFLEKANENELIKITNQKEIVQKMLSCLIQPFVTLDWWQRTLAIIDQVITETPCYVLRFDKSGKIVQKLNKI